MLLSKLKVSMIGSIFSGVHFCSGPFSSALINSIGFRKSGVVGSLIASLCMFIASKSDGFVQLEVFHGLCGIGTGILSSMANICVGYHFNKYRAIACAFASCGTGFGTFAIMPFINLIIGDSADHPGHLKNYMLWEAILLLSLLLVSLLASKPEILKIKADKWEKQHQSWMKKVFGRTSTEKEKEDETIVFVSDTKATVGTFTKFQFTSRASTWSTVSLSSLRTMKAVKFQDTPTLAEIFEILPEEPESEIEPPKQKFSLKTFFSKPCPVKKILKPTPLDSDDIFHSESTTTIANCRARFLNLPHASSILFKKLLLTRAPPPVYHVSRWKRFCFQIRRTLLMIFDISMFKSWTFNVLCAASFSYALAFYVPLMYITGKSKNFLFP